MRGERLRLGKIIAGATLLGVGIGAMHYTGMAAAVFLPWADCRYDSNQSFFGLALAIGVITAVILGAALFFGVELNRQEARDSALRRLAGTLFYRHAIMIIVVSTVAIFGVLFFELQQFQSRLVQLVALENATNLSKALSEFRTLYTSEVATRAQEAGMHVTHDYQNEKNAIPLPATLSMMLGSQLSRQLDGGRRACIALIRSRGGRRRAALKRRLNRKPGTGCREIQGNPSTVSTKRMAGRCCILRRQTSCANRA